MNKASLTADIPRIIKDVLASNQMYDRGVIEAFLSPKLSQLPPPQQMKGMTEAVELLVAELRAGTDIIIWGDYDVDGTTGTALLVNFFRQIGTEALWHIPNRLTDGYGLHIERFQELHQKHCQTGRFLLITVDCGISNHQEIDHIISLGGKVIVTDHHQLPIGKLPDCIILNPNQAGCGFTDQKLSGVGVAFYLAAAVRQALVRSDFFRDTPAPNMKELLGFAALGTIADLVEITPVNRILVRAGMESLTRSTISGLNALMASTSLSGYRLTTEDISFCLAPRINAAGRLGKADTAVSLLTCDNIVEGMQIAKTLEAYNDRRRGLCSQTLESILSSIDIQHIKDRNSLVVHGEYHIGIVGIVAAKLVEMFGKPTIVLSTSTHAECQTIFLKGSGRSTPGVDLLQCLHQCKESLYKYGGHAMAAGMTLEARSLADFCASLERAVTLQHKNSVFSGASTPTLFECSVDEVFHKHTLDYLQLLEPFGPGNERPHFVDQNASIVSCRQVGDNGQHLQLTVRGKYENYRGVGFGLGKKYSEIKKNSRRPITFTPMISRFKGAVDWQIRVTSI